MIEAFISDGNNTNIDKLVSAREFDCRRNYAIVCQTDKKDYPWDYGNPIRVRVMGLSGTAVVITDTSSSPYISVPLFGSFS